MEPLPRGREGRGWLHLWQHVLGLIPPSLAEIARNIHFGRQEDAHEFLRYTIDAMQKACLNGCTKYVGPLRARRCSLLSPCWSPAPVRGAWG